MATKQNLVEALKTADLDELRSEIAEKEANLDKIVAERRSEIDALKLLARTIDVMRNGKPKREMKPRQAKVPFTRSAPGGGPTVGDKAVQYLSVAGPSKCAIIADSIKAEYGSVYAALNKDPRVKRIGEGVFGLK